MSRQKEGLLDDKILKDVRDRGYWGMKTGGQGIPDLICCIDGVFVAMETKVDKNTMSDLQKWQLNKIKNAKGVGYEVRSFNQYIEILEEVNGRNRQENREI